MAGCRIRSAPTSISRRCAWRSRRSRTVLFNPVAQSKFVHTVSGGLCDRRDVRAAISAWYLLRGRNREFAQALDDGGRELRARVGAVGRRARRRIGLHGDREPEDEDRRDRGDVGDRARAGGVHGVRHSRMSPTHKTHCASQDPVGAGPDRHALARQRGARASTTCVAEAQHADRERHHGATRRCSGCARNPADAGRDDAVRCAQGAISATRCCC